MDTTTKMNLADLTALVIGLQARIVVLETPKVTTNASTKEMTDDDARNILFGDLANTKHKDAAATLGLTYGQIYSCRLGYTFKNIHKEGKDTGKTNPWMK